MPSEYERALVAKYLANAAARFRHGDREAGALAEWLACRDHRSGFDREGGSRLEDINLDEPRSALQHRRIQQALRDECAATQGTGLDLVGQRLRHLGDATDLTPLDIGVLELLLRYETEPLFESMVDDIFDRRHSRRSPLNIRGETIPTLLDVSPGALHSRLADAAPLVSSGLVVIDSRGNVEVVERLKRLVSAPDSDGLDVLRLLLDAAPASDLEFSDFDHLAKGRDHIERLVKGALESGEPGMNVLLHGPPGTGKTEFCKVLAQRLGVTLYSVGEADDWGDEPNRRERLQDLRLAQRLLGPNPGALLLFDEMEDLLSDPSAAALFFLFGLPSRAAGDGGSKVFMNRLLERTLTPTLWTMNNARSVDPAFVRRMKFVMELRPPTTRVRARIFSRQLKRHGIDAEPGDAEALARDFAVTPGVTDGATAAARIMGGGIETVRFGVRGIARALSSEAPSQGPPPLYDPALIRADRDPVQLADSLVKGGRRRFSLCLHGPPGTGKSAFVRYLAERMGLELMPKRASDLMSAWVGETEQRIADAFAEARDAEAFLVFDEADSLLANRRFAQRSWEVTQVNEMLTWMESHPLPFACTTNFAEHLDPAALRRFIFKITLNYLSPTQVESAFRRFFGCAPPAQAAALTALTPGDFAVVRTEAEILGLLGDPDALSDMLSAECAAKPKPERPCTPGFKP